MAFLTDDDRQRIAETIAAVEQKTSGELVTAIASVSDGYRYIPILLAAILTLLVVPVIYFGNLALLGNFDFFGEMVISAQRLMLVQIGIFVLAAILFQLPLVRRYIIPRQVQRQRARRLAYETFYKAGVHRASHRAGILIFVSIEERYVQIVADEGVARRVDNSVWDDAVANFVSSVRAGKVADGFIACIDQCGEVLATHFPPDSSQPAGQLANHLIELDGQDL